MMNRLGHANSYDAGMVLHSMRITVALLLTAAAVVAQPANSLVETLSILSNDQLSAWKRHDKVAYLAVRDPRFVYVGPLGIVEPGHPVDNLMRCKVVSYALEKAQAITVDANTAILIAELHQDATCFGTKQPAVVNISETYTRHAGRWRIILRTEAPAMSLPTPVRE